MLAYPEMVFFIGLKPEVKTRISPVAFSTASSSLRPTTASGGMLKDKKNSVNNKTVELYGSFRKIRYHCEHIYAKK